MFTSINSTIGTLLPDPTQNEKALKYGPLSIEYFSNIWESFSPKEWIYILGNVTYFPNKLLLTEELLEDKVFHFDSKGELLVGIDFIALLRTNPYTPKSIARHYINEWLHELAADKDATAISIEVFMETWGDDNNFTYMAFHKNTPVPVTAKHILESMTEADLEKFAWKISIFEKKCNKYLVNLGWEQETLDVTPLSMKLEIVA